MMMTTEEPNSTLNSSPRTPRRPRQRSVSSIQEMMLPEETSLHMSLPELSTADLPTRVKSKSSPTETRGNEFFETRTSPSISRRRRQKSGGIAAMMAAGDPASSNEKIDLSLPDPNKVSPKTDKELVKQPQSPEPKPPSKAKQVEEKTTGGKRNPFKSFRRLRGSSPNKPAA